MKLERRLLAPLRAQVLILVMVSVVVAQLITIAAVAIFPVLPQPTYTLAQVADALAGKPVDGRSRRRLEVRLVSKLPNDLMARNEAFVSTVLAGAIPADTADVRFVRRFPSQLVFMTSLRSTGPQGPGPRQPGPPPGQGGPADFGPDGNRPPPPGSPENGAAPNGPGGPPSPADRPGDDPMPGPPGPQAFFPDGGGGAGAGTETVTLTREVSEFAAARRLPDGRWRVVQPGPELEWLRRVTLWLVGGMAVMGPIAWVFSTRITRPLRRFADAADQLGRDPQGAALSLDGPAEVGLAARAFNDMQKRLQKYVSDRVSMTGAISHDLRTPLTRIRFQVEGADAKLRDAVLKDVAQMETMISATLAFIRDSDQRFDREKLDLTTLLACAVDDRVFAGDAATFDEAAPNAVVEGDPIALRRLFDNLIDNAIKYGEVAHVTLEKAGLEARVTVSDEGRGLSSAEIEKVFAPFYRTQSARENQFNGTGLGLTIVRSVARAHGGDVQLRSRPGGLAAVVTLPLAPE